MTRNEYIAQLSIEAHRQGFWDNHLERAIKKADEMEAAGCAPWQAAPPVEYQNSMIRSKMPQSPGQVIQFDLPTRREITAADVQPGAIFTDEDGGSAGGQGAFCSLSKPHCGHI